jgi:putative ABC transport system permease protein
VWRVTLIGLVAHKVRYALTALAVLLGVAFMAGTLVLTATIGRTFDGLFTDIYSSTSAVVRGTQAFTPQTNFTSQRSEIDASLAERVHAVPGVAEMRSVIEGYAQLVGSNGKAIGTPAAGAPTLGEAWNDAPGMTPYHFLPGGRPPQSGSEVAIDKHSADVGKLAVGDRVVVLTKQAPATYTITGIFRWGSADSPLGASITIFDPATAAKMLGEPGKVDEIDVAAAPGISQLQMVARLRAALPAAGLDIVTGSQVTHEGQDAVHNALSFFNTFLLIFALIALFVGSFLIFNTFSIVIAQRLRELALLRAVGASRAQITLSVLAESLMIGVLASAAGIGVGIGLAIGLRAMLDALGVDIPSTGLYVSPRTVALCMAVGTVITVLAALVPARRAGQIAPIAALRTVELNGDPHPLRRTSAGTAVAVAGLALIVGGLVSHIANRVALVGAGAAAIFIGLAILGPLVSRPLSRILGAPLRWRGPSGQLARNNAMRSPKRTSATAAALMVGVALVALVNVLASSIRVSAGAVVDTAMRADFVISAGGQPGGESGFSPTLQQRLSTLPEVATSTGVRGSQARVGGTTTTVLAVDPRHVNDLFDIGLRQGDITSMTADGIAVSQAVADSKHLTITSPVTITFPSAGSHTFHVAAIYSARELAGDYVLPLAAAETAFPTRLDFQVYVKLASGVPAQTGRHAIDAVLSSYPTAKLLDRTEYKNQQVAQIDQLLNLVYGLLGLALGIALIGIANTLALSIYERTHELGLVRAIGMTRAQLRSTVRLESVIIALLGAAEGLAIGTVFGVAIVAALRSQGVSHLSIPVAQLVVVAFLAGLAGVLAAVGPARRAARLDILRAIAAE